MKFSRFNTLILLGFIAIVGVIIMQLFLINNSIHSILPLIDANISDVILFFEDFIDLKSARKISDHCPIYCIIK